MIVRLKLTADVLPIRPLSQTHVTYYDTHYGVCANILFLFYFYDTVHAVYDIYYTFYYTSYAHFQVCQQHITLGIISQKVQSMKFSHLVVRLRIATDGSSYKK